MESNNNKLIVILMGIIIVILGALCVLFATGTISFNSKDSNSKENETVKEEEKENLPEWVSYILKQDITEISYYSGVPNEGTGVLTCEEAKSLTKDQLKTILVKMSKNVKKIDINGLGGPCWSGIKVKYGNKEIDIYANELIISTDNNDSTVLELLAKENYTDLTTNNPESSIGYSFTWDDSYIDTILK